MPHRILIAPDKFKGSLTAAEAAAAMMLGIRQNSPDAQFDICPIADGGEGFMETLSIALNAQWIACPAVDALGRNITSRYALANTPEGPTAIIEMAETAGLSRLSPTERNPTLTTTRGVGIQIAHAISQYAVTRIILGIGGSATNDGGCGMAAELGIKFFNADGQLIDPTPLHLHEITHIDYTHRIALPPIIAACDVDNPLLGPHGATAIFSAQKGATSEHQITLESALTHLVQISHGSSSATIPGAGAAGGLGFGLLHFANASLTSGFDVIAELLDLKNRILQADLVLTGEGSLDHQSLSGKGPVALACLANSLGVPVIAFCGHADLAARSSGIFQSLHALTDTKLPLETLIQQARPLLTELVASAELFSPYE